jgi:hypothetical protein
MQQGWAILISVVSAAVSALMALLSYLVTRHTSKPSLGIDNWDMKYQVEKNSGLVSITIRLGLKNFGATAGKNPQITIFVGNENSGFTKQEELDLPTLIHPGQRFQWMYRDNIQLNKEDKEDGGIVLSNTATSMRYFCIRIIYKDPFRIVLNKIHEDFWLVFNPTEPDSILTLDKKKVASLSPLLPE